MKPSLQPTAAAFAVLILASASAFADSRIQLVQGKRAVKDSVSFTIDIAHLRDENPRYAKMPEYIQIEAQFATAASGFASLDGTGIVRFDESQHFRSNPIDITYGRHVVTLRLAAPAAVVAFYVTVPGGSLREVMEEGATAKPAVEPAADERIGELERRLKHLEAEVEALKHGRRTQ